MRSKLLKQTPQTTSSSANQATETQQCESQGVVDAKEGEHQTFDSKHDSRLKTPVVNGKQVKQFEETSAFNEQQPAPMTSPASCSPINFWHGQDQMPQHQQEPLS